MKQDHDLVRDGPIFIFVKPMRDLPKTAAEVEKKKEIVHIPLSGWKGQYDVKHPRYQKVLYSSHSSPEDLEEFCKRLDPGNLVFNLEQKQTPGRANWQLKIQTKYSKQGRLAAE